MPDDVEKEKSVKKSADVSEREWETTAPDLDKYCVVCGAYDPTALLRFSTDKRGHGSAIYARLPQDVPSQIEAIVQSGKFGFKTSQEFIREAVFHRLFYYRKIINSAVLDITLSRLNVINRVIEEENANVRFQSDLQKLRETINFLTTYGGENGKRRAKEHLKSVQERVEEIPDPFWRRLWLEGIRKEWPDLA